MSQTRWPYWWLKVSVIVLLQLSVASAKSEKDKEKSTAEKDFDRIVKQLPAAFKKSGLRPLMEAKQEPDERTRLAGYAKVRLARTTSETTAKVTVSFYSKSKDGEDVEFDTLILYWSRYKELWTVTKADLSVNFAEGGAWRAEYLKLLGFLDEISAHQ